jgi:RNAse (barnase) inhibitor barstar
VAAAQPSGFLEKWAYQRIVLDGRRMTSRHDAHVVLAEAVRFPDYYGKNWDAFSDCFGDFVEAHNGQRFAVLWEHIEVAAKNAPATTAEVGWALLDGASGFMPSLAPGTAWTIEMDVFATGTGHDFDQP